MTEDRGVLTPLGSGLAAGDGRYYGAAQRAAAFSLPSGKWRAEISGVEGGVVVRSWIGPEFDRKEDALAAAKTRALSTSVGEG